MCISFPFHGGLRSLYFSARVFGASLLSRREALHRLAILVLLGYIIAEGGSTTRPYRTWSTGVGMFHRPLLNAATHHGYTVINMCSNSSICPSSFPQAYNVTPFKWLKSFNWSTYSSAGHGRTLEWMLHCSLLKAPQLLPTVKTEGAKTGLLSAIWSPMIVTNESTLQPSVWTY